MANQDLGGQLSVLTSINEMIGQVTKGFENLGSTVSQQIGYMEQLAGAADDIDSSGVKDMTSALEEMASGADDAGASAKKMGKQLAVAGSVLNGAAKGMSTFKNVLGGTFNAVSGLASGIFNLAKGAVGALMSSWSGLLGMAQDIASKGDDIAKAYEAVRGEFGNLASNEGKAVVEMNKALRNEFASTAGMSLGAIYGTNLTGALEAMSQMAQDLGASFNRLADDFVDRAASRLRADHEAPLHVLDVTPAPELYEDVLARSGGRHRILVGPDCIHLELLPRGHEGDLLPRPYGARLNLAHYDGAPIVVSVEDWDAEGGGPLAALDLEGVEEAH